MILCFTGSGNSLYVADKLCTQLGDEVVSLNNVIKADLEKKFVSNSPFIVVAPIYAWRLPRIIENLILSSTFEGSKQMYFVPTMGSQTGNADKYCAEICKKIGMEFMGLSGVSMPDNYVLMSKMPGEEEIKNKLAEANVNINHIAQAIKNGIFIKKTDKTMFAGLLSGTVNKWFVKYATSDKKYNVNKDCISCGLCEIVCPVNNIKLEEGKPVFTGKCIACYSCIHRCPKAAINIGNKTQNHGRYLCPES